MEVQYKPWFETISKCAVAPIDENLLPEGAIFGFSFPNTFSEKEAWLKDPSNSTKAYFFENNVVKVYAKEQGKEVTWLIGYNYIAKSTYGPKVIPLPLSVDAIMYSEDEVTARIGKWIEQLNLLPFILAAKADTDDATEFIEVCIPSSWSDINKIITKTDLGTSYAVLKDNGQVSWGHPTGENIQILQKYIDKDYASWTEFYNELRKYLAELLNSVPESPSITEPVTDEAKIAKLKKMKEDRGVTLQQWLNAFNEIPGIKAELSNGSIDSNRVMEITVLTSTAFLLDPNNREDYHDFNLLSDGTAEESDAIYGGDECSLYMKWAKTLDYANLNWQMLYDKLVELSTAYLVSVPVMTPQE